VDIIQAVVIQRSTLEGIIQTVVDRVSEIVDIIQAVAVQQLDLE
jgi:hypothetical protein